MLEQVDAGTAGNTRQNRADTRSGINRAVDFEEAVHGTDFLDILVLDAVQPQGLLIAEIMCLDLRDQGGRVVAAALGEAGTTRACTGVLVLNEDLNRVNTGGVVCANRRADDDELVGLRGADTQMRLGCDDKRADVQRSALSMRNPILFALDQCLDSLNEILNRYRRQAHTCIGIDHTLCVAVRTEQLNLALRRTVCLQTLKGLHGIVQDHCSRIQLDRCVRYDAGIMPADALRMIHDEHVISIVDAETEMRLIRLLLLLRCRRHFDVKHVISLFSRVCDIEYTSLFYKTCVQFASLSLYFFVVHP